MNMKVIKISKVSFDILFFFGIIGIVLMTVLTVASPFIVDAIQEIAPTAQTGTVMGVEFSIDAAELDDASAKQVAYAGLGAGLLLRWRLPPTSLTRSAGLSKRCWSARRSAKRTISGCAGWRGQHLYLSRLGGSWTRGLVRL